MALIVLRNIGCNDYLAYRTIFTRAMFCPKIKLDAFFFARKAVDELWEVVLDLPTLQPTSPRCKLSVGHRQGRLVLAPTQAVAVIVVVAIKNAAVSPVAAVIAVPTDPPLLLLRLLLLLLLPMMSCCHRHRQCVIICRQLQPGHMNGGAGGGSGGAPLLIVDATAPSIVAAAAAAALATVGRAAIEDVQEGQEVFVEEGGVIGIWMIIVIIATAFTNIFCGALAVVAN